jgi:hypothetical protein
MAESEELLLSDKSIIPTDDLIFTLISENKVFWIRIMDHISENYKDFSGQWNYYNDGKRWLYKMAHKKKTIFWAAILTGTFRITFYFSDKAEPVIEGSDLSRKLKDEFKTAKKYGLIRPVSLLLKEETDVENVIRLIAIKYKIK